MKFLFHSCVVYVGVFSSELKKYYFFINSNYGGGFFFLISSTFFKNSQRFGLRKLEKWKKMDGCL